CPSPRRGHERIHHLDAKQLVCAGKSLPSIWLPSCRCPVCARNPENHAGVPGAGRGAAKAVGYRGAALVERRAIVRKCEPVLAYSDGNTSGWPAGVPRKQSESLGGCVSQPGGVVADADEQRKRCPLAQSDQVAAGPSRKLTSWASRATLSLTGFAMASV